MVTLFNLIAIFGSTSLVRDDQAWYRSVLLGEFPSWLRQYDLITPYTEWMAWQVMAFSPFLARALYVVLLLVPISCCFYYLYRTVFGFPREIAFMAAILPQILPMAWQIPTGINMSYVVWGLFSIMLASILGFHFLAKESRHNWARLLGAGIFYWIAAQIMEQTVFVLPPLLLAYAGYKQWTKKHLWLTVEFFLIAMAKLHMMASNPRKAMQWMPLDVVAQRIGLYFQWALPVPNMRPVYATIVCVGIILIGFVLYMKQSTEPGNAYTIFSHLPARIHHFLVYGFWGCWMIASMLPIIVLSIPYQPRYAYIAMFATQALLVFSIHIILKRLLPGKGRIAHVLLLCIMLLGGICRIQYLGHYFALNNKITAVVAWDLGQIDFPRAAQIAIVNFTGFDGGWFRASGYLEYTLKRSDLSGVVGGINDTGYYNFANHFDPHGRGWGERYDFEGLTLDKPLFLFYYDAQSGKMKQMDYALFWQGQDKNAPWSILRVDRFSGHISICASGKGMAAYENELKEFETKAIGQAQILWGGPATTKERMRLEDAGIDMHK